MAKYKIAIDAMGGDYAPKQEFLYLYSHIHAKKSIPYIYI